MQWTGAGFRRWLVWGVLLGLAGTAVGQAGSPAALQTDVTGALQSLASRAATIFSGQVVAIDRHAGVVEITFRVEQRVAGSMGPSYTLREWAGLWPVGQFRYHVGERALLFVHASSLAGFASSVNGQEGVVPVIVQGANAPMLLDVRRLAASIKRAVGTPLAPEGESAVRLTDAVALITAARQAGTAGAAPLPELPHVPMPVHVARFPSAGAPAASGGSNGHDLRRGNPVALDQREVPYAAR